MASETASAVASTDLGVVVLSSALRLTVRLKVAAILCMMSVCGTSTTGWGIKPLEVVCCDDGLRIRSPHHGNSMLCNFSKKISISWCVVWQQHWKWRRIKWLKVVVGSTRLVTVYSWCCPLIVDNSHSSCNCGKNMINPCHWWLYGIQQRRQIKVLLSFIYKRKHWKL